MERIMRLLRGEPIKYYLIEGETKLINKELYPYDQGIIPLTAETTEKVSTDHGFASGIRSITKENNGWFKAKGTGILFGETKHIYKEKTIYTYQLKNKNIAKNENIWGFIDPKEAENEIKKMLELKELDLPTPTPIGIGYYKNIKVTEFRSQNELFNLVKFKNKEDIIKINREKGRPTTAACIFYINESDIRVDEILYGLLMPKINELIDVNEAKAYLKWLGSSCAYNLKRLHDQKILHGTRSVAGGIITNSYLSNHTVSEITTGITDLRLSKKIENRKDEKLKLEEYYALWHLANPLPAAEKYVNAQREKKSLLELPELTYPMTTMEEIQKWDDIIRRHSGVYTPTNIYEEFTDALIEGIEYGYNRRKILEVERKMKREMLIKLAVLKNQFLKLYGLPEGMERGKQIVNTVRYQKKISEQEIKKKIDEIKEKINELL